MNIFPQKSAESYHPKDLFKAIESGNEPLAKEILKAHPYYVDVNNGDRMIPLKLAAKHGHLSIVKMLVKRGAEVYAKPVNNYPAVMDAAWNKHQEIVNYFLYEIPDKASGTNGLGVMINLAARQGWKDIVVKHIEKDPLAVHQRGWIGDTALHWSCHNNYAEIVTLLLDHGADIEADEINWIGGRPLHWASEHAPECTKILLERGGQVNARNVKEDSHCLSRTPLIHNACQNDDCAEVTKLLIQAGADLHAKDNHDKTALDWAKEKKNSRIAAVLENAGNMKVK